MFLSLTQFIVQARYLLPTDDAVYDFHKLKIGDCYCLTINEAHKKAFRIIGRILENIKNEE